MTKNHCLCAHARCMQQTQRGSLEEAASLLAHDARGGGKEKGCSLSGAGGNRCCQEATGSPNTWRAALGVLGKEGVCVRVPGCRVGHRQGCPALRGEETATRGKVAPQMAHSGGGGGTPNFPMNHTVQAKQGPGVPGRTPQFSLPFSLSSQALRGPALQAQSP